jgi:hypothetical protein
MAPRRLYTIVVGIGQAKTGWDSRGHFPATLTKTTYHDQKGVDGDTMREL